MITRAKAHELRKLIEKASVSLSDEDALSGVELYPEWKVDTDYEVDGNRLRYNDKLYRTRQAHHSQAEYTPDITPALWELVVVDHSGTADDPIPFDLGMAIEDGKYYTEDSARYKCIRDSINPLYNHLADLIGIYVVVE
jgi:hypothetical protein